MRLRKHHHDRASTRGKRHETSQQVVCVDRRHGRTRNGRLFLSAHRHVTSIALPPDPDPDSSSYISPKHAVTSPLTRRIPSRPTSTLGWTPPSCEHVRQSHSASEPDNPRPPPRPPTPEPPPRPTRQQSSLCCHPRIASPSLCRIASPSLCRTNCNAAACAASRPPPFLPQHSRVLDST
ncbi:hypothetical protein BZA05DRAFT_78751 [Tricharina praecox]|uniref:uncharacterized protein n=1 Tax=Tricharina praecox TaxID=43433 RepID=UPI0022208362|nr:uncharacterized protein BZA05DRAFT_78751 [Tricharina praecox]KAI5849856.1 hypothetical protein BZA05DRAFT_78751 [Tricharina praecox]